MKIEMRVWQVILIVGIVIGSIWALNRWSGHRHRVEKDKLSQSLYQSQMVIERYEIRLDSMAEYVSQTELIILSRDRQIMKLTNEKERLRELNIKNVRVIGDLKLRIQSLKDSIPPSDTIIIKEDCEGEEGSYIKLPLEYIFSDRWITQSANVNMDGIGSLSFSMAPTPMKVILGDKKTGLFKTTPSAIVTTPNPYITIDRSQFVIIDNQVSPWRYVAYGAGGGAALIILLSLILH